MDATRRFLALNPPSPRGFASAVSRRTATTSTRTLPAQSRRSTRAGWLADTPPDTPASGRVRHPRLGRSGHRARAVGGRLGALQQAHHARARGLLLPVRSRPHLTGARSVSRLQLTLGCGEVRLLGASGAADYFLGAAGNCAPPLGVPLAHLCDQPCGDVV